jgi:hypothetical protein
MNTAATDHGDGWRRYGMSLPLPPDASQEMRDGYAEHRADLLSRITAHEGRVTIREPM